MQSFSQFVTSLLHALVQLGNVIVAALVALELWLRGQLAQMGLPPLMQTVVMLALAALLIIGSLRLFGGLIRVIVVLVLILIALHILLPALPH